MLKSRPLESRLQAEFWNCRKAESLRAGFRGAVVILCFSLDSRPAARGNAL